MGDSLYGCGYAELVAGQEGAGCAAVDRQGELERFQSIRRPVPGDDQEWTRVSSGIAQPEVREDALRLRQTAEVLGPLSSIRCICRRRGFGRHSWHEAAKINIQTKERQAEHIAEGYESHNVSKRVAKARARATVNKIYGGGEKGGLGRRKDI